MGGGGDGRLETKMAGYFVDKQKLEVLNGC